MGDKVIYDAGLPRNATVASIINGNTWQWPTANSPELLVLKEDTLQLSYNPCGSQDRIHWPPSSSGIFSIRTAWEHIRQAKALVPWKHIVLFSGNLPKASFILWLAVKGQLGTQDRLHNLPPNTSCLLCSLQLESHNHLFFYCPYSQQLWHHISLKGDFITPSIPWGHLINWLPSNWKGKSLQIKTKLLCLSITIYYLWRERNSRFHSHTSTGVQDLLSLVVEDVRLKLSTYRGVQDTSQHRALQVGWSLPDSIFSISWFELWFGTRLFWDLIVIPNPICKTWGIPLVVCTFPIFSLIYSNLPSKKKMLLSGVAISGVETGELTSPPSKWFVVSSASIGWGIP